MAARKLCPSESEPFEDHPGDPMYLRLVVEFMLVLQTLSIFTEVQREMVPHFFARKAALREMFAECKDRLDIVGPGAGFADAVARFAFLHEDAAANPNVYTHLRNLYGRLRWFLDDCDSDDPTLTVRVLFRLLRKHGVTVSTSYRTVLVAENADTTLSPKLQRALTNVLVAGRELRTEYGKYIGEIPEWQRQLVKDLISVDAAYRQRHKLAPRPMESPETLLSALDTCFDFFVPLCDDGQWRQYVERGYK